MEGGRTACRVNCHAISSHYPHTFISTFRKLKSEIGSCKLFPQVCTHSHCTTSLMFPKTLECFFRFSGDAQTNVKRRKRSLFWFLKHRPLGISVSLSSCSLTEHVALTLQPQNLRLCTTNLRASIHGPRRSSGSGFGFDVFTRCKHHPTSKPPDLVTLNWVSPRPLIIANF